MQEVFYEESASLHNEKPAKRRYILFTVVGICCILSAVFSFFMILSSFFVPMSEEQFDSLTLRNFFLSFCPLSFSLCSWLPGRSSCSKRGIPSI